jgi:hypothetical protein
MIILLLPSQCVYLSVEIIHLKIPRCFFFLCGAAFKFRESAETISTVVGHAKGKGFQTDVEIWGLRRLLATWHGIYVILVVVRA